VSETIPEPVAQVLEQFDGLEVVKQQARRLGVRLPPAHLPQFLARLKGDAGYLHLSAISCVDWPQTEEFELVYHVGSYETGVLVSAHIRIPRDPGQYVSLYDLFTPAAYFERDIHEMFGVAFAGMPDDRPFVLSEWHGPPPMRKDFSSMQYVADHFSWRDYRPEWLEEIEGRGGGITEP
jgi:NADH-quinone oxidoreductase subunit C